MNDIPYIVVCDTNKSVEIEGFSVNLPYKGYLPSYVTMAVFESDPSFIPWKSEQRTIYAAKVKCADDRVLKCVDLAFLIDHVGDISRPLDLINKYLRQIFDSAEFKAAPIHAATRGVYYDYPKMENIQLVLARFYRNADFECHEHPELLMGMPIGMYHCPICMEMLMAGCRHLTAAEMAAVHEGA